MTLLGPGSSFEGLLLLPDSARIDGRLCGQVVARGDLEVGPTGEVEADLEARSLRVEGRVRGDLRASARIALGPGARVEGRLSAPVLSIEEGARVDGPCCCGGAAPQTAAPS